MGGAVDDYGNGIVVDSIGNVYTTGYFKGTADFDPGAGTANLTSAGDNDIFVSKLDSSGNFIWAKSMGGTGIDAGCGIAVDLSGNVYTTGYFNGTADFDPGRRHIQPDQCGVRRYLRLQVDGNGGYVWAKSMGGTNDDLATTSP